MKLHLLVASVFCLLVTAGCGSSSSDDTTPPKTVAPPAGVVPDTGPTGAKPSVSGGVLPPPPMNGKP